MLHIERRHFKPLSIRIDAGAYTRLETNQVFSLGPVSLTRKVTAGFWVATVIFVVVLALIASGKQLSSLAALLGASLIYAISYLVRLYRIIMQPLPAYSIKFKINCLRV
ncbi:MAG: hypothetical protein OEY93_07570 [Anaerolineae bacterium]|nr:hypothetical protein [Anaerolineae bacterium]